MESIQKERMTSEAEASVKPSKNLIKKLGVPLKSIAEDFKEAWQDARQEILQETRDLVKNKLLKSKATNESNESEIESFESSDDRKTKTIPKKKGIVADAKRIKKSSVKKKNYRWIYLLNIVAKR